MVRTTRSLTVADSPAFRRVAHLGTDSPPPPPPLPSLPFPPRRLRRSLHPREQRRWCWCVVRYPAGAAGILFLLVVEHHGVGQVPALSTLINVLNTATSDKSISGVLIDLSAFSLELNQAQELGSLISQVRKSGKRVAIYSSDYDTATYLLASYADTVIMPEQGDLLIPGAGIQMVFFKNWRWPSSRCRRISCRWANQGSRGAIHALVGEPGIPAADRKARRRHVPADHLDDRGKPPEPDRGAGEKGGG